MKPNQACVVRMILVVFKIIKTLEIFKELVFDPVFETVDVQLLDMMRAADCGINTLASNKTGSEAMIKNFDVKCITNIIDGKYNIQQLEVAI